MRIVIPVALKRVFEGDVKRYLALLLLFAFFCVQCGHYVEMQALVQHRHLLHTLALQRRELGVLSTVCVPFRMPKRRHVDGQAIFLKS